jgi:hypothetical protein
MKKKTDDEKMGDIELCPYFKSCFKQTTVYFKFSHGAFGVCEKHANEYRTNMYVEITRDEALVFDVMQS